MCGAHRSGLERIHNCGAWRFTEGIVRKEVENAFFQLTVRGQMVRREPGTLFVGVRQRRHPQTKVDSDNGGGSQ